MLRDFSVGNVIQNCAFEKVVMRKKGFSSSILRGPRGTGSRAGCREPGHSQVLIFWDEGSYSPQVPSGGQSSALKWKFLALRLLPGDAPEFPPARRRQWPCQWFLQSGVCLEGFFNFSLAYLSSLPSIHCVHHHHKRSVLP